MFIKKFSIGFKIQEREYILTCDGEAPTTEVREALKQWEAYIDHIEEVAKESSEKEQLAKKEEEIVDSQTETTETTEV